MLIDLDDTILSAFGAAEGQWRRVIDEFAEHLQPRDQTISDIDVGHFERAIRQTETGDQVFRRLRTDIIDTLLRQCPQLPGVFETDLNRELLKGPRGQEFLLRTPMKRFGRVEELVGAAVYLASDAATFVTGQLLAVDGGLLGSGVNQ